LRKSTFGGLREFVAAEQIERRRASLKNRLPTQLGEMALEGFDV
jgi:hypothetical protein